MFFIFFSTMATVLTAKQASALALIERQENNLGRIELGNAQRYQEQAADIDLTPTLPERKPAFVPTEDLTLFLNVGDFIKADAKTDAGFNCPEGYGYIVQIFWAGAAAYYSVKYTPAFDGGRTHRHLHLVDLTPCSPFDECIPPE